MITTEKQILTSDYPEFGRFSHHPFIVDGKLFDTVEHYYQSSKCVRYVEREKIRNIRRVSEVRYFIKTLRPDLLWELTNESKINIMRAALNEKMSQHDEIMKLLLSTKDIHIIDDVTNDIFWGIDKDGNGDNMLGKLLMEIRNKNKFIYGGF